KYYVPPSGYYIASIANWNTTASPTAPTSSELPTIGAIQIFATTGSSGYSRTITTFVRLRNSPYKSTP
ncbi:MAG TPA: hypothetical protein VGS41_10540, partial [Chthonomonadales bacterium]|nr:hypothetical protein [Chthonomonadales bacterium]